MAKKAKGRPNMGRPLLFTMRISKIERAELDTLAERWRLSAADVIRILLREALLQKRPGPNG
jgi:hypothetical protein